MSNTIVPYTGVIFDAYTGVFDASIAQQVAADPNRYGTWSTRQKWYGRVYCEDNKMWRFESTLEGKPHHTESNSDVFDLIDSVVAKLGR